jgi:hypothetical protein
MSKAKKNTRNRSKPSVNVQDLSPQTDPKGARKGEKTVDYFKVVLKDIIVT